MQIEEAIQLFRDYLKNIIAFDADEFDLALPYFSIRELRKGMHFVEENKTCTHFAFMISGLVRAYRNDDGEEATVCLCGTNTFATSTVSFITQTPSNTSTQALDDVVLLTISYHDLQHLYTKSTFWQKVGRIIAEKELMFIQKNEWRNSKRTAMEKYQMLLTENPGIVNRVPLQFIASYLGIQPETLSRLRKKLVSRIS
jgi:CRP-like cAMP-binding protein